MEELTNVLLEWGLLGLIIASFTESFISPILPDLILIPLALAQHEKAIVYGLIATTASVAGGGIGYWIGQKVGVKAARRMIPDKYIHSVQHHVTNNAVWAIFLAALSPIPYKFVCITAGALRIQWPLFMAVSFLGRAKRFLLEGILIFYFGPAAIDLFNQYSEKMMILSVLAIIAVIGIIYLVKRSKKKTIIAEADTGSCK